MKAGACAPAHLDDGTCWVPGEDGTGWSRGRLPDRFRAAALPAVCVELSQARAYARWAKARLPTDSEFERAARAGRKGARYPWGDAPADCSRAVMPDASGDGCGRKGTWPPCSKPRGDAGGLCDMAGNVWSFVEADAGPVVEAGEGMCAASKDGGAFPGPGRPLARGGSWRMNPAYLRVSFRFPVLPFCPYSTGGIRLFVSTPSPNPGK